MASTSTSTNLRMAGKPFSQAAVNFLVSNAGYLTTAQIARRLGRTPKAIRRKAEKLNVSLAV